VPESAQWNAEVWQVIGTRLFLLFMTALLVRHLAQARNRLSEDLSHLSEQLALAQERNRIAREIHDGIGHSLVNCILTLELCERLVGKEPDEARKVIEQETADLRAALDDMRDFVHHLRPADIENQPFEPLVRRYLAQFGERTGLTVRPDIKTGDADLPPSARLVLLRIIQEALTNAAKHSDATEVDVTLTAAPDHGVDCVIVDNGCGFDVAEVLGDSASRHGFGLRTMIDRAQSAGGELTIQSAPGEGTRITLSI
jgi:signal transduction histidine kinase